MFIYEKKLQFPVKIATPNPKLAAFIISQYGGGNSNRLRQKHDKYFHFLAAYITSIVSYKKEKAPSQDLWKS